MSSGAMKLSEIPTVRLDQWKTINPDALFFLHVALVTGQEWTGPSPPNWDKDKDRLANEVLSFEGLLNDAEKTERVKACLAKLDKTYLLDFLVLFGLQQQNGRTFNRRHSPASLSAALMEYLNSPGERFMEVHKIISSNERPIRANRSTATLNEDQDEEEFGDGAPPAANNRVVNGRGGRGAGTAESNSEEEEEEWGVPESTSSASKKRRINTSSDGGKDGGKDEGGEQKGKISRGGNLSNHNSPVPRRRGGGGHSDKKAPSVPLRSNPPRTPTVSHPINYNVNQNFSALTSALSHARTTYVRGGKPKRGKEKVAADLWVACDLCEKWRLLPPGTYESEDKIPSKWQCSMYPTPKYNDCSIPEDTSGGADDDAAATSASSGGSGGGGSGSGGGGSASNGSSAFSVTSVGGGAGASSGAAAATAAGAASVKKIENDPMVPLMKKMQRRVAKNKKRLQEQAAANEQMDEVLEHMLQMEEPIEEEEDNEESGDDLDEEDKRNLRLGKRQRAMDPLGELLAEDALQPREEEAIETSFMLADMALARSSSGSRVPEFFRGRVNVVVADGVVVGVLQLTENETVWDVRCEIGKMIGVDANHVVLMKNGCIPIHKTQDTKLAYWFLGNESDYLQVFEAK